MTYCPQCNEYFSCGRNPPHVPCWCMKFPLLPYDASELNCLCPTCLKKKLIRHTNKLVQDIMEGGRVNTLGNYASKNNVEGLDYYVEDSTMVFTAWYHLKRGTCCGNSYHHCPYGHKNVRR